VTTFSPTVADVSRAIAFLDENACSDADIVHAAMRRVSRNLAYQFAQHNGWGGRRNVSTRDIRAALIAHGASSLTVQQYARRIASAIRSDFSDGRTP
jgi:hypothetical protein